MSTQPASPWTDERIEMLKHLWAKGHSCSKIAQMMGGGLTRSSIVSKAHRLELPRRASDGMRALNAAATHSARASSSPAPTARMTVAIPKPDQMEISSTPSGDDEFVRSEPPCGHHIAHVGRAAVLSLRGNPLIAGSAQCRYPIGFPGESDFHFCPQDRIGTGSYCAAHTQITGDAPRKFRGRMTHAVNYIPRCSGMEKSW